MEADTGGRAPTTRGRVADRVQRYGVGLTELLVVGLLLAVDVVVIGHPADVAPGAATALAVASRRFCGLAPAMLLAVAISLLTSLYAALAAPAEGVTAWYLSTGAVPMSLAEQGALVLAVVLALRETRIDTAVPLAGAAAVAVIGSPLVRTEESSLGLPAYLSAVAWGGAFVIGLALRESAVRRQVAIDRVRIAERMELARELHDVVAHHVTGIAVAAQAAGMAAHRTREDVDEALGEIETASSDAMAAMRAMVDVLRGQRGGLAHGLPGTQLRDVTTLIRRFDPGGVVIRLTSGDGLDRVDLPTEVTGATYRVVREALTNVRRHAPTARRIDVDLRIDGGGLLISVRNDGAPEQAARPPGRTGGFGLVAMTERIQVLGGRFTSEQGDGGTWSVRAWLPVGGSR